MLARCRCDTLIPYRNINQTNSLLLLYERNASLPSINKLVSVTVTVSSCFCSCPFPCVPEYLFWFLRSLPLCSCSCHGPCVPVLFSVPARVPVAILDPFLVSLCSRVQAPFPSTPLCYILFYVHFRSTLERQFLSFSTLLERGYNTCKIC